MRLTVRALGIELVHVEVDTDPAADDDLARDLSGGSLDGRCIDADAADVVMGFTNGRECE